MDVTRDILDKTDLFKKAVIVALGGLGIGPGVYSAYDVAYTGASLDQAVRNLQFSQGLLDSFGMITAVSVLAILCHLLYIDKKKEEGYYFLEARAWFTFCAFSTLVIIVIPDAPGSWGMLDDFTDLYPLVRAAQCLRRGILLQSIPGFIESIYSLKIIQILRKEGPLTRKQIVVSCCKESLFDIIDSMEAPDSSWGLQSPKEESRGYIEHQLRNFQDQMTRRKFQKLYNEFIMEKLGEAKGLEPPKKEAIENFLKDLCDWEIVVKNQGKYMLFPIDAYRFEHEGIISQKKGKLDKAEEHYKKALKVYDKLGLRQHVAEMYCQLGIISLEKRNLAVAEESFIEALKVCDKLDSRQQAADMHYQLGLISQKKGKPDKAEEHYKKALKAYDKLGLRQQAADMHCQLGLISQKKGKPDKAEEHYKKALKIYKDLKRLPLVIDLLVKVGALYQKQSPPVKSIIAYRKAVQILVNYKGNISAETMLYFLDNLNNMGEENIKKILDHVYKEDSP